MKKRFSVPSVILLILLFSLLTFQLTYTFTGNLYQKKVDLLTESGTEYPVLSEADALIRKNFVGTIDDDTLETAMIRGYLSALPDRYSRYLTAEEYRAYKAEKEGKGSGIGVRVLYDTGAQEVVLFSVFPNSPAAKAGLMRGDVLYKIDGSPVSELGYEGTVDAIAGDAGTKVKLVILREVAAQTVQIEAEVERGEVQIASLDFEMLPEKVGYIRVYTFDENTAAAFEEAVQSLMKDGAKALIFDLRDNGGGRMDAACKMLDVLLSEGCLIRTTDRDGNVAEQKATPGGVDLPMALLVNGGSASASEIFAGALKDHKKAVLVGETTYGKGTAQAVLELKDGSALILSNLYFSPPFSDCPEGAGIEPDIPVKNGADTSYFINRTKDEQLRAALKAVAVPE